MAKKNAPKHIEFPFYSYLKQFHDDNRKQVYSNYKPLTKKFLNFNNPENPNTWLRKPQFEALEIYVFLKEFCENKTLSLIFREWFEKSGPFEGREITGVDANDQLRLFGPSEFDSDDVESFEQVFSQIEKFKQAYSNYIFALTMGLGKTVLMATTIFYEFLLANKHPRSKSYCHNALVFAPDKTVLQSLKEIETFDKSKVVPSEYVNWLDSHLKFHFLDDSGLSLNILDGSKFNIIISNTQKIILKKQHKEKSLSDTLFSDSATLYKAKTLNEEFADLYEFDAETEAELLSNQRFEKLTRIKQLGIYVDEAHHVFGNNLAKDFGVKKSATSLRVTINELAAALTRAGTHVVGCYNYTGTPYVGKKLLPEVVYAYGLKEAIDNKFLKKVSITGFDNIRDETLTFVRESISDFWQKNNGQRYEGLLPKFAFFASSIDELQKELRPAVEEVLAELGIPITKILVNVGDDKITSNDDLREFRNLDTPESEKQFILLVNKGKEGWNCRSLFGVGLHREPKSKIFVLQATMRCLRAITAIQQTGLVYLSSENIKTLDKELEDNFNLSVEDVNGAGDNREPFEVKLIPPPVKLKLKRIKKIHQLKPKVLDSKVDFEFDEVDWSIYEINKKEYGAIDKLAESTVSYSVDSKEKREFSTYTLISEIARYLYHPEGMDGFRKISVFEIEDVLNSAKQSLVEIVEAVNKNNKVLYDIVIPKLFTTFYEIESFEKQEEEEIELVKEPENGFYSVKGKPELLASLYAHEYQSQKNKSFHLDNYVFDSVPELDMFRALLADNNLEKVYFTGMLTHGQSDFMIRYIDPESHTVRSYYPDFLVKVKTNDGADKFIIIEVKGDNKIDDIVVKAKADYASQLAGANGMEYKIIAGSVAKHGLGYVGN